MQYLSKQTIKAFQYFVCFFHSLVFSSLFIGRVGGVFSYKNKSKWLWNTVFASKEFEPNTKTSNTRTRCWSQIWKVLSRQSSVWVLKLNVNTKMPHNRTIERNEDLPDLESAFSPVKSLSPKMSKRPALGRYVFFRFEKKTAVVNAKKWL